jgi:hypothetical protein
MNIKFYLLWFENEPTWVQGKIDDIKDIIEEEGFEWIEPLVFKKETEFTGNYDDFDMILVDYRLVGGKKKGKTGADIIDNIRKDCYSNIIFYSQDGEDVLRGEIAERNLDGVFCVSRDDFLDRFEDIFHATIKKVEDVNNLRGLVMAETADLESIKNEIIELYDKSACPKKKEIIIKSLDEITGLINKNKIFFDSTSEKTTFGEFLNRIDFYRKSMIIHRINHRKKPVSNFDHDKFNKEIIVKRNLLAHVKEKKNKDGEIYLESKNKKLIFSQDEAKTIRKDILKYKIELEKLKKTL